MKNISISIIRFLALLSIILCHILQGLHYEAAFWFNLGVQVFFFISGFLYGNKKEPIKNILKWYKKQFSKIMLPFIILFIILLIIDTKIFSFTYSKQMILGNMLGLGGFYGTLKSLSHCWFISYILLCYLITPILYNIDFNKYNNKQRFLLLLLIALSLQFLQYFGAININAAWIFNYVFGFYFSMYYIKNNYNYKKFLIKLALISFIILVPRLDIQYDLIDFNYPAIVSSNVHYICSWSHMLLGSFIFISLFYILSKFKLQYNFIINSSDKLSYYIYLTHQVFILNHLSLLHLTKFISINILIIIIVSISTGFMLYFITNITKKILCSFCHKYKN